MMITLQWPICAASFQKEICHYKRSAAIGAPIYCGRKCAGLARRVPEVSDEDARAAKKTYDAEYRARNSAVIKAKKGKKGLRRVLGSATIEWINESMEPDEVFDNDKLESWAESNGFTKEN